MKEINNFINMKMKSCIGSDELHYPLLESMLYSDIPATIHTNSIEDSYFIMGDNGWCYQLGNKSDRVFNDLILKIIEDRFISKMQILWFGYPNTKYKEYSFSINLSKRYEFEYLGFDDIRLSNKTDFEIHFATADELSQLYYEHDDIPNYWSSVENFVEKGFSYIAKHDNKIIGYALSASNSNSKVEIDIWTMDKYRRRGLSMTLCNYLLNYCNRIGLQPKWDCSEENIASIGLAIKLGFQLKKEYILGCIRQNQNTSNTTFCDIPMLKTD